jgi:galactokinase
MAIQRLKVSAPGRICLFGEHLDYLNLPVITAAINLRIAIEGTKRNDYIFYFALPDIGSSDYFDFDQPIPYLKQRDYLRSAVNVLVRQGVRFPCGYDCHVHGEIPINAGNSSSSALTVAWVKFLLTIAEDPRRDDPVEIAKLAYQAEVLEFDEPGGIMDHFATSVGSVLTIDIHHDHTSFKKLPVQLDPFVLGNSLQPKDTQAILKRVKGGILEVLDFLSHENHEIDLRTARFSDIKNQIKNFPREQIDLIEGTFQNLEITTRATRLFHQNNLSSHHLGKLLSDMQRVFQKKLRVSTPKLDRMLEAAITAGALGGKLNGSGGGGCMFALAPDNQEDIAAAIEHVGAKAYHIHVDEGVRLEQLETS